MNYKLSRNIRRKSYLIPLIGLAFLTTFKLPSFAAGTAAGTTIDNTAHGSFENPNDASGTEIQVDSNTVRLTISEVAGLDVSNLGTPEEAPAAEVVNDGPGQGDSVIGSEDVVYFTYRITNTGNDQTQFFIPSAPSSVTNATFQAANPVEIVSYFDGNATTTPLSIDVTTGNTTGTFAGIPNGGSVPVGGHIDVRVPVKADAGLTPGTSFITVVLGDTPTVGDQNIQFSGTFPHTGNDVTTFDNPGTTNGDLSGAPAFEREGSISQQTGVGTANLDYGDAPDATPGVPVAGDYNSAPGRGPSHVVSAAPTIFLGSAVDAETDFSEDDGPPLEDDAVVVDDGATNPSLHGETFVAGQTYTWDVETNGTGELTIWVDFDGDGDFEDDGPLPRVASTGATESVSVQVPFGATGGATYARVRYSSQTGLPSTSAAPDGEVEDYEINIDAAAPALRLVKRVTRVGVDNFTTFVDDGTPGNDDNSPNWPSPVAPATTYLEGAIAADAEPGEQVDYTVYFLSDGNTPISNIKICDLIPPETGYIPDSLVINLGNAGEVALSDASGAEAPPNTTSLGEKFADTLTPPAPCPAPDAGMDEGGIYVEVPGPVPNAIGPGTADSFGYIRFTVQVD